MTWLSIDSKCPKHRRDDDLTAFKSLDNSFGNALWLSSLRPIPYRHINRQMPEGIAERGHGGKFRWGGGGPGLLAKPRTVGASGMLGLASLPMLVAG